MGTLVSSPSPPFPRVVTDTLNIKSTTCNVRFTAPTTDPGVNVSLTLPPDDGNAGQFLQTDGTGVMTWQSEADGVVGNEVVGAAADSTIKREGAGTAVSPYTLKLNLQKANTWTATQTDTAGFVTKYETSDDPISASKLNAIFGSRTAGWFGTYYDSNLDKMYWVTTNGYTWWWMELTKAP